MAKNIPMTPPPAGTTIGDVVYALCKHKWKIILCSLATLAGAGIYYLKAPVPYQSNARLVVRYLVDRSAIDQVDSTATAGSSQRGVESLMASQLAILTSWDLARGVAAQIDGDIMRRLLPPNTTGDAQAAATGIIYDGLEATAAKESNVLDISFRHHDPSVASLVLNIVLKQFEKMHLEVYRSAEAAGLVIAKVGKSATSLRTAEEQLSNLRKEHKVLSLTDAMSALSVEMAKAQTELGDAETKLAEQQARVTALERLVKGAETEEKPPVVRKALDPDAVPTDNPVTAADPAAATAAPTSPPPDSRTVAQYQLLLTRIGSLRSNSVALLARFTPENEAVRVNQAQLDELEAQRRALESKHPELAAVAEASDPRSQVGPDLLSERAALVAAEARVNALKERVNKLTTEVEELSSIAPKLSEAERTRELEDSNYKYLKTSEQKAQTDQDLATSLNAPNLKVIQSATPAMQDKKRRDKIALAIAGGGPAAVVGLVLLFSVLLNRTVKRPAEFEDKLGLPLMMAVPYFKRLKHGANGNGKSAPRLTGPQGDDTKKLTAPDDGTPPWDPSHAVRPHAEAIRDRLGLYFESHGLDHKPKLIAVTGQTAGAGASTIASSIAAALSETGDGKVLLVDMGGTRGAAHPFFDGRPAPALSTAIRSSRGAEEAADNLFIAKADGSSPGATSIGAARLSRLMPDLKASYFDYIIFDMPPLGNTSPTPAMAAFMDQLLVVVEAETSTREEILRQHRDLTEHHAKVSMVLNKVRPHGPRSLMGSL